MVSSNSLTAHSSPPPRGAVGIVGSAGGISALIELLSALPVVFPFPIVVAQHLFRDGPSVLPAILGYRVKLPAAWAEPGELPQPGIVHVVRPGCKVTIDTHGFTVSPLARHSTSWLSTPDALLSSLADGYGAGAVGIVLSGMLPVGIGGLRAIQRVGGTTMAQSPRSASHTDMPIGAIDLGRAEIVSSPAGLALALMTLASLPIAA